MSCVKACSFDQFTHLVEMLAVAQDRCVGVFPEAIR